MPQCRRHQAQQPVVPSSASSTHPCISRLPGIPESPPLTRRNSPGSSGSETAIAPRRCPVKGNDSLCHWRLVRQWGGPNTGATTLCATGGLSTSGETQTLAACPTVEKAKHWRTSSQWHSMVAQLKAPTLADKPPVALNGRLAKRPARQSRITLGGILHPSVAIS